MSGPLLPCQSCGLMFYGPTSEAEWQVRQETLAKVPLIERAIGDLKPGEPPQVCDTCYQRIIHWARNMGAQE